MIDCAMKNCPLNFDGKCSKHKYCKDGGRKTEYPINIKVESLPLKIRIDKIAFDLATAAAEMYTAGMPARESIRKAKAIYKRIEG